MPSEETLDLLGVVTASDEVIHVHPSSRSSSAHRDHWSKRRKHNLDDAIPPEFTATQSKINGATEPLAAGGAHRSQRSTPAEKSMEAGDSSSKDDDRASAYVAPPPASSRFIRFKPSSSLVIGSSSEQQPAAGSSSGGGHSSYYANNHAPAASSSSPRFIREPAAPSSYIPKARRPPSGIVPREPDEDDECFHQGVVAFGSLDVAAQLAEVKKFAGVGQQPQPLPEGGGFSFWLTPEQAAADLAYVYGKVNAGALRKWETSQALTRNEFVR